MKRMGFRKKLLISILVVTMVSVGVLAVLSYRVARSKLVAQEQRKLAQMADLIRETLQLWVADREREVVFFAENGVFQAACGGKRMDEARDRLEKYHQLSPLYENVFLLDPSGVCFLDSLGGKALGVNIAERPEASGCVDAALAGKSCVGDVEQAPITGLPVFVVTAPITVDGRVAGIMGTAIDLIAFADVFLKNYNKDDSSAIFMVNADGVIISHPDREAIFNQTVSDLGIDQSMLRQDGGPLAYTGSQKSMVGRFATYGKKGWRLVVTAQRDTLLAPVRHTRNLIIGLGAGVILLMVMVTWGVTGTAFKVIQRAVSRLEASSAGVSAAGGEILAASNGLAEGASQQAASLEETGSTLEEIAAMTKTNADNASQANGIVSQSKAEMDRAEASFGALNRAMDEIRKASEETQKIVGTIDEIAFQTNLLALNAAVEAARAGEAGAGFAVVAGEVRNLAMRAAKAAQNTADLIDSTVTRVREGAMLADGANQAFSAAAGRTARIQAFMEEIAAASTQQANGIEQVNRAVSEMDRVTQHNAAAAEQSASAAEEMNAQAGRMKRIVADLTGLVGTAHDIPPAGKSAPDRLRKGGRKAQPGKPLLLKGSGVRRS